MPGPVFYEESKTYGKKYGKLLLINKMYREVFHVMIFAKWHHLQAQMTLKLKMFHLSGQFGIECCQQKFYENVVFIQ